MSKSNRAARGPRGYRNRLVDTRNIRLSFLIVCEGEKTEPNYFKKFRARGWVPDVRGLGENTVGLVKTALEFMTQGSYDQVWCVFDRDEFPAENFNAALELAARHGINVAYSNESFELWYVLHFDYCDAALSRSDYCRKLDGLLGHAYKKESETIYEELFAPADRDSERGKAAEPRIRPAGRRQSFDDGSSAGGGAEQEHRLTRPVRNRACSAEKRCAPSSLKSTTVTPASFACVCRAP